MIKFEKLKLQPSGNVFVDGHTYGSKFSDVAIYIAAPPKKLIALIIPKSGKGAAQVYVEDQTMFNPDHFYEIDIEVKVI